MGRKAGKVGIIATNGGQVGSTAWTKIVGTGVGVGRITRKVSVGVGVGDWRRIRNLVGVGRRVDVGQGIGVGVAALTDLLASNQLKVVVAPLWVVVGVAVRCMGRGVTREASMPEKGIYIGGRGVVVGGEDGFGAGVDVAVGAWERTGAAVGAGGAVDVGARVEQPARASRPRAKYRASQYNLSVMEPPSLGQAGWLAKDLTDPRKRNPAKGA